MLIQVIKCIFMGREEKTYINLSFEAHERWSSIYFKEYEMVF
jgi:hypothetical protein